ncbi:MAG TPA: MBL fold metallo-hydrolase [Gemmataceae bacterium]|nr:MBL fold metallo-hydrolase [Gemmataceae bacterium]
MLAHFMHARGLRRLFLGGLTALVLALALYAAYRSQSAAKGRRPGDSPESTGRTILEPYPVTLAPGLHLLGGLAPAAAYVVETSGGLVLIDAGMESDARSVKQQMKYLGLDWHGLRAILLTHAHGDHSGGAERLRAATGARIYAGAGDASVLRAGQPREAFYSTFYVPDTVKPVETVVDVELSGGETIEVGDARFQVLATPGHSPGSTCYLVEHGGLRVLFSGDVIMSLAGNDDSRSPYARSLGTYTTYLAPRYRGDARAFLATLRSLRDLPAPDLVLPGHPRMDAEPQNAAMTQTRWETLLEGGIREMEQLLERYARDGLLFLDDLPKELLPGLYYLGDRQGVAVYGLSAGSRFFLVNAPGIQGFSAFAKARLRQLGLEAKSPNAVLLTSVSATDAAGIRDLLETWPKCQVVASPEARPVIQEACAAGTDIVAPDEFSRRNWIEVEPLLLSGRMLRSTAYVVHWEGKAVLFSGRIPLKAPRAARWQVMRDFARSLGDTTEVRDALAQLRKLKPDLWLPALPADGQNANLYPGEWTQVLGENEELLR